MNPEQEKKMKEALGDGSDWPKFTNDAEVNYEIDRKLHPELKMPPWNEAHPSGKDLYLEEVELVKQNPFDV